jgi:uncharacterized protein YndB with AHSA1/START domain
MAALRVQTAQAVRGRQDDPLVLWDKPPATEVEPEKRLEYEWHDRPAAMGSILQCEIEVLTRARMGPQRAELISS